MDRDIGFSGFQGVGRAARKRVAVGRKAMVTRRAPLLRERPRELPADRGERLVEPFEGRPRSRGLEAAETCGLVPVLALVGAGEAAVAADRHSP